ncbi:MAG: hypothetical protein AAGI38_20450, partial [Bacteroidota bacterium]
MKRLIGTLLFVCYCLQGFGQIEDTLVTPYDDALDQIIEDAVSNTETEDQVDFTIITDYLNDLR